MEHILALETKKANLCGLPFLLILEKHLGLRHKSLDGAARMIQNV